MNTLRLTGVGGAMLLLFSGCNKQATDTPPVVRLGDSVCEECNMIISDERWATATIVEGPRGAEPRLFDDFNCQVNYEIANPDLTILGRWSHSHTTRKWIRTGDAHFLMSPGLRTPMASSIAAFASESEAEAAKGDLAGDVMSFEVAWKRLGRAGACCHVDKTEDADSPKQERPDAP